jgi:hypothetical protein
VVLLVLAAVTVGVGLAIAAPLRVAGTRSLDPSALSAAAVPALGLAGAGGDAGLADVRDLRPVALIVVVPSCGCRAQVVSVARAAVDRRVHVALVGSLGDAAQVLDLVSGLSRVRALLGTGLPGAGSRVVLIAADGHLVDVIDLRRPVEGPLDRVVGLTTVGVR